jgi:hypothetical protein
VEGDPTSADVLNLIDNIHSPVILEIGLRSTSLPPDACDPGNILGCIQLQNGVNYHFTDIRWSDGTADTINFLWVVSPEPGSVALMGSVVVVFLLLRRGKRNSGRSAATLLNVQCQ